MPPSGERTEPVGGAHRRRPIEEISATDAPASIGPFLQAIRDGDRVYVSGQGPVDPETGEVVSDDVREQTERTLENVDAVLAAADLSLADVVKATVFLTDMENYDAVSEVYGEYISDLYPARSAVEVSELPIEIEVVASTRAE